MYPRRLQFRFIELHVDSLVVVKAITSHGHGGWRGRSLVEKIIACLHLIGKLLFTTLTVKQTNARTLQLTMVVRWIYFFFYVCRSNTSLLWLSNPTCDLVVISFFLGLGLWLSGKKKVLLFISQYKLTILIKD